MTKSSVNCPRITHDSAAPLIAPPREFFKPPCGAMFDENPPWTKADFKGSFLSAFSVLTLHLWNLSPVIAARANPLIGVGSSRPNLPTRRQVLDNFRVVLGQAV